MLLISGLVKMSNKVINGSRVSLSTTPASPGASLRESGTGTPLPPTTVGKGNGHPPGHFPVHVLLGLELW